MGDVKEGEIAMEGEIIGGVGVADEVGGKPTPAGRLWAGARGLCEAVLGGTMGTHRRYGGSSNRTSEEQALFGNPLCMAQLRMKPLLTPQPPRASKGERPHRHPQSKHARPLLYQLPQDASAYRPRYFDDGALVQLCLRREVLCQGLQGAQLLPPTRCQVHLPRDGAPAGGEQRVRRVGTGHWGGLGGGMRRAGKRGQ